MTGEGGNALTIVIVDDDIIFLNKLNEMMGRNQERYTVVASATTGERALALVEKYTPDLLIADIEMPGPNGIELLHSIRKRGIGTEVLILSNFSHFEYVRAALCEGAVDYVLKDQLDATSFFEKLKSVAERIDRNRVNLSNRTIYSTYMKQKLLLSCAEGTVQETPESAQLFCEQEFCSGTHAVVRLQVVDIVSLYEREETFVRQITSSIQSIFQIIGDGLCAYAGAGSFLLLFDGRRYSGRAGMIAEVRKRIRLIENNLMKIYNVESFCFFEIFDDKVVQLRKYDLGCIARMDACLLRKDRGWKRLQEKYRFLFNNEIQLVGALCRSDLQDIARLLEHVFSHAENYGVRGVIEAALELYKIGCRSLEEFHAAGEKTASCVGVPLPGFQDGSLTEGMKEFFLSFFHRISILNRGDNLSGVYSPHVTEAFDYVRQNYGKELSIEIIAQHLHISSVYFSHLFKMETGVAFSNYLCQYRISMAKDLLRNTGYSLAEITQKVGFQNYNYFIQVFKKQVGITPLKYRSLKGSPESGFCPAERGNM